MDASEPRRLWALTTGVGALPPFEVVSASANSGFVGSLSFEACLVVGGGLLPSFFCSRILLCIRILWRWRTAMRLRSLQTLLAVSLGSPKRRRELRVWSVKMVPAVPTRMGQMMTSYPRVWLR